MDGAPKSFRQEKKPAGVAGFDEMAFSVKD
jgi:hypothetical protein